MHKHKVNETRLRSIFKTVSGRLIEIGIGAFTFGTILSFLGFPYPYEMGLILNIVEEVICFIITYFTERIWNKVNWGREVEDIEGL